MEVLMKIVKSCENISIRNYVISIIIKSRKFKNEQDISDWDFVVKHEKMHNLLII